MMSNGPFAKIPSVLYQNRCSNQKNCEFIVSGCDSSKEIDNFRIKLPDLTFVNKLFSTRKYENNSNIITCGSNIWSICCRSVKNKNIHFIKVYLSKYSSWKEILSYRMKDIHTVTVSV